MIICGPRKGNKYCGLPCCSDLRYGAGSRTTQNQIGPREKTRHVFNEPVNLRRKSRLRVRGQHVIIVTLSGLMDHVQSRHPAQQRPNRARHRLIDCTSSLTSTEYEQSR